MPQSNPRQIDERYIIERTLALQTCTYYEANASLDGQSHRYLICEQDKNDMLSRERFKTVEEWPPGLLPEIERFVRGEILYTVLQMPDKQWQPLSTVEVPVSLQQAVEWTLQVGHILRRVHPTLGEMPSLRIGLDRTIVKGRQAQLAGTAVLSETAEAAAASDGRFLGELLFWLHTGKEVDEQWQSRANEQLNPFLQRAFDGSFATLRALLTDLQTSQTPAPLVAPIKPDARRPLRQSAGLATHQGMVREHNEDSIAKLDYIIEQNGASDQTGLYIVADGMGGHAAGELASRNSAETMFRRFIDERFMPRVRRQTQKLDADNMRNPYEQLIRELVTSANDIVYQSNLATHADRGCTITAALVIGRQAFIANVGDSRAYLFRAGRLQQISEDHSLVFRLYQAQQISREEMYTHPEKNVVLRSLGEKATVEVDVFGHRIERGDQLLLCSDGLWEMVRDNAIADRLRDARSPQVTCDQLISDANANGGEDNISVMIVLFE